MGEGERVPLDLEITDEVGGDTVARYSFVAESAGAYAVFLAALEGSVFLAVTDSLHQYTAATLGAGPNSPPLYENAASIYPVPTVGRVYHLSIGASPGGSEARFRFVLYAVRKAPELRPATFVFGDTVSGETIDPMVDIDVFVARGEAGQEIVAVGETPGTPGSGSVALSVIDPVTPQFLGFVFADAGTETPLTTGRIRLPATRDYHFVLSSVTSNVYPRYRGAYRFWTYVVNPAPEHRPASLPKNVEVAGERIDREGDLDEFTFSADAGAEFNAFLQASRAFNLEIAPQGGAPFAIATADPADTVLFGRATGRFGVPQAGTYVLRVSGTGSHQVADTGAYRTYLLAVDPRPERAAAAITPGDTVAGEEIDQPGDVDEFTFSGPAGAQFNAFLQGQNGLPDTHLKIEVLNDAGAVLATVRSAGSDSSLWQQVTGRFTLPSLGTYRLRVSGDEGFGEEYYGGGYRLFLYRVEPAPESSPGTLALGDSVMGEAIDLPGDLDEFRVTVLDSSGANLAFAFDGQLADGTGVIVRLLDAATEQKVSEIAAYPHQGSAPVATGRLRLAPGEYLIRIDVTHFQLRPAARGPYRLWLYRFGFEPEQVPDTFAVADTVTGETIAPWGDADRFVIHGVRGQHVNAMLQGLAAPSDAAFEMWISVPGADFYSPYVFVITPTASNSLEEHQTTRLVLPTTGWYGVEVHGAGGGISEQGAYRFAVVPVSTAPEQVGAALSVGDSVTTESIDAPGDWDEFTVTATPGQDVSVITHGRDEIGGSYFYLLAFDPATFDTLAWQPGQFRRIAGPFRVPASGQFKIAVHEPKGFFRICYDATCGGLYDFVGPHGFGVVAVNRPPESVPAAYTVGDTVRGETISPIGDIDEFTSTATPGEELTPYLRLTARSSLDSAAVLEVIDPTTGTSLAGSSTAILGASFASLGPFTVPQSGSFVIRVRVYGQYGYGVGETAYEFFVKRGS